MLNSEINWLPLWLYFGFIHFMTLLRNNNFEQLSIWQTANNCAAGCSSKASWVNTEVTLTCFVSGFIRFKLLVEIFNIMLIPANWRLLFPKMLERTLLGGCEEGGKKQIFVLWFLFFFFEWPSLYAGLVVILKASKYSMTFQRSLNCNSCFPLEIISHLYYYYYNYYCCCY